MNRLKLIIFVALLTAATAQANPTFDIATPVFTQPDRQIFIVEETIQLRFYADVYAEYCTTSGGGIFCQYNLLVNDGSVAAPYASAVYDDESGCWVLDDSRTVVGPSLYPTDTGTYELEAIVEVWVFDPDSSYRKVSTNMTIDVVDRLVDIDIKPGSSPNSINLGSNGVVPVAILSSETFDATQVDPETVTLAGSGVAVRGKGNKYLAHQEDVNDDGLTDLVCQVETENLDPGTFQNGSATLLAYAYDGSLYIGGSDEITIVPPE